MCLDSWYNSCVQKGRFYITTTTPYVNADPHIGFALEVITADVIARYHSQLGEEVVFNTGTDEHGLKIYQQAQTEKLTPQQFTDKYSQRFRELKGLLNLGLTNFIRTTEKHHEAAAQEFWRRCDAHGDIYKKLYKIKYCVGCELEKTESELVDGKCPIHPNKILEIIEEENYFFRFSKYQDKLLNLIDSDTYKIFPQKRKNEVVSFIKSGLEDFSISRSNERAHGVGVPLPGDDNQKIYVWFDALTIYMTGVGWGYDEKLWRRWWPADLHIIGKDIIRFHAVYWPAMLLSAGLPLPKALLVHGFISSGGRKMSKTLGNVIDPYAVIKKYGVEPLRYFLLSQIPTLDDGDFTVEAFKSVYQADLANGLGNLAARLAKLCEKGAIDKSYFPHFP